MKKSEAELLRTCKGMSCKGAASGRESRMIAIVSAQAVGLCSTVDAVGTGVLCNCFKLFWLFVLHSARNSMSC